MIGYDVDCTSSILEAVEAAHATGARRAIAAHYVLATLAQPMS